MRTLPLLVPILLATSPLAAESNKTMDFQFLDNCAGMRVVVEDLSRDAKRIDLTESTIRNAAESRVRSANLYEAHAPYSMLVVNVTIVGRAFGTEVSFWKRVTDFATGYQASGISWISTTIGTHGNSSDYVLGTVNKNMDEFLASYLRVNEQACEDKRAAEYAARQAGSKPPGSGFTIDPALLEGLELEE